MKLSVINGSPRGESSNSTKIINWIVRDLKVAEAGKIEYLANIKKQPEILERCMSSDSLLFCFPLYVDSMPAQQKYFFELMEENKNVFKGKSISFIIHSGFPEMIQSISLKEYLELFAELMGMKCLGVAIIGGSEALQLAPENMFSRQIIELRDVIECIDEDRIFPEDLNLRINKRLKLTGLQRLLFTISPLKNFYWHYRASKHKHKVNLRARPY